MVSNGWLYKLRRMGRARSHHNSSKKKPNQTPPPTTTTSSSSTKTREARQFSPRKSYYFTREVVPVSPRKSSKQGARGAKSPNRSSPTFVSSSGCSYRTTLWTKRGSPPSCSPVCSSPEAEFRADCVLATNQTGEFDGPSKAGEFPELKLPPIITRVRKVSELGEESKETEHQKEGSWKTRTVSVNIVREEKSSPIPNPLRRISVSSPGVKLRVNSPKLARRRMERKNWSSRRSLGESTAVVKSSADPKKDFRESMVEMIRANNIRGSKDLEDLLACYLSLNSDEYHHLIINVFKQIWFDLNQSPARLK